MSTRWWYPPIFIKLCLPFHCFGTVPGKIFFYRGNLISQQNLSSRLIRYLRKECWLPEYLTEHWLILDVVPSRKRMEGCVWWGCALVWLWIGLRCSDCSSWSLQRWIGKCMYLGPNYFIHVRLSRCCSPDINEHFAGVWAGPMLNKSIASTKALVRLISVTHIMAWFRFCHRRHAICYGCVANRHHNMEFVSDDGD